jgi:glycosyltransferase involved in cell wall biosynthesis
MKILYLFSGSFPYSSAGENSFIPQELDQYCLVFDKVVLVPISNEGEIYSYSKNNLEIVTDYSYVLANKNRQYFKILKAVFDINLWAEIFRYPLQFFYQNPKRILHVIASNYSFYKTKDTLNSILSKYDNVITFKCIMTYWFDQTTTSISRLGVESDSFISRAHGYDLYEFRSPFLFFPFREVTFKKINYIFSASEAGAEYLKLKYSQYSSKIFQASLGMYNPEVTNIINDSNVFKIVTCSFLQPVKRLDLIFKALEILNLSDKIKIKWVHIGNGPLFNYFQDILNDFKCNNIEIEFLNYYNQKVLFEYYKNNAFDLFLNVSESEGRPVSIMEALACGIPVLATNVGGNPEIVNNKVGFLIDGNLTPEMLADKLEEIYFNRSELLKKRKETFYYWNNNFNALNSYDFILNKMLNKI